MIHQRDTRPISVKDCLVSRNDDEFNITKRFPYESDVGLNVADLVGNNNDAALVLLSSELHGSPPNIERSWGRLDHDEGEIDLSVLKSRQRSDSRLEIGNNNRFSEFTRAEQLLSGQATSRSTGVWVLDPSDHREADPIGPIGPKGVDDLIPFGGVLHVTVVKLIAKADQTFSLKIANAERDPEIGIRVAVESNDITALPSKGSRNHRRCGRLARSTLAYNSDLHRASPELSILQPRDVVDQGINRFNEGTIRIRI